MDLDDARAFIREHHAVMATRRADGGPQMSLVACNVDGDGRVVVSTARNRGQDKDVRRDPHTWLYVLPDRGYRAMGPGIDGTAEVLWLRAEAMEPLMNYCTTAGEHPDWDDYRAAMDRERRVLIALTIERATRHPPRVSDQQGHDHRCVAAGRGSTARRRRSRWPGFRDRPAGDVN